MTIIGSRFSQIIRQKSATVLGKGPGGNGDYEISVYQQPAMI